MMNSTRKRTYRGIMMLMLFFGIVYAVNGQLQQSGGPGSVITFASPQHTINDASSAVIGHVIVDTAPTTTVTGTFFQATQPVSGTVTATLSGSINNTAFGASAGVANIGIVRSVPSSCTQSTNFANATSQVGTGAGTSVTSTTTCVTFAYANNITNSAVTLRLADKAGTPVIWLGGNADFGIPANSNIRIPIDGVTFTSGITAIAGTASAINLQVNGLQ